MNSNEFIRRPAAVGDTTPLVRPLDELDRIEESVAHRLDFKPFEAWLMEGRHVRRGEKHQFRNIQGDPMFHRSQTQLLL